MAKYDVTIAEKSRRVQKPEIIIVIRKITFFQEVMGYCKSHCGAMVIDNLFFFTHTNFCCAQAF